MCQRDGDSHGAPGRCSSAVDLAAWREGVLDGSIVRTAVFEVASVVPDVRRSISQRRSAPSRSFSTPLCLFALHVRTPCQDADRFLTSLRRCLERARPEAISVQPLPHDSVTQDAALEDDSALAEIPESPVKGMQSMLDNSRISHVSR